MYIILDTTVFVAAIEYYLRVLCCKDETSSGLLCSLSCCGLFSKLAESLVGDDHGTS